MNNNKKLWLYNAVFLCQVDKGLFYWVVYDHLTQARVMRNKGASIEKMSP